MVQASHLTVEVYEHDDLLVIFIFKCAETGTVCS